VTLAELPRRTAAIVDKVEDNSENDTIARRLRELGFVAGEPVEIVAVGPFGAEPLLVQVGYTRFALRRTEASRVTVTLDTEESAAPIAPAQSRALAEPVEDLAP
jgi:ferrous iron transport protein A